MGTKERQQRDRDRLQQSILTAARELFVAEGYRNVSMRKIADRIEYSPAAIYSYFPSKDDIFFALAEEGFRTLLAMPAGKVDEADDLKAIRNAFWRVYEFSISHPEYFALMFVDRTVPRINKDW
jgi:AcrR family transcriptional regulator